MKDVIIFDLDGTLSNPSHRLKYLDVIPKNWDAFFESCDKDTPIEAIVEIINSMYMRAKKVGIITGRSDSVREKTTDWLEKHGIPYDFLLMRGEGDHRPDKDLKKDLIYDDLVGGPGNIWFVVEDMPHMGDHWNSLGVPCLLLKGFT